MAFASGNGLDLPRGLAFDAAGNLYVASLQSNEILKFQAGTGIFLGVFASAGLQSPTGLAFGPDGDLYAANQATDDVRRYDGSTGSFVGVFASGGGLDSPQYLAFSDAPSEFAGITEIIDASGTGIPFQNLDGSQHIVVDSAGPSRRRQRDIRCGGGEDDKATYDPRRHLGSA